MESLYQSVLFMKMIFLNQWLWAHVLLGGVAAKIFLEIFKYKPYKAQASFSCVLGLAVAYEIFEYLFLTPVGILDSCGDVLGAILMALVVVF